MHVKRTLWKKHKSVLIKHFRKRKNPLGSMSLTCIVSGDFVSANRQAAHHRHPLNMNALGCTIVILFNAWICFGFRAACEIEE